MTSVIIQIASRYIRFLLVLFALIALFRGHNLPGGGFIGGLLAGLSIVMKGFAYDIEKVRRQLWLQPEGFIATGLSMILVSALAGFILGEVWMTGLWTSVSLPLAGELKLGTPLLFDIGVFHAVIGVTLMFLFSLKKA